MVLALVTSWFRGRELALAMGISAGAAFTLGKALALFGWVGVIQATGWSTATVIGGVIGLVIFLLTLLFLHVPNHEAERLAAGEFSWKALGRVLGNRELHRINLGANGQPNPEDVQGPGMSCCFVFVSGAGEQADLPLLQINFFDGPQGFQ